MKLDQITSNLDIFMDHKGGINSLKDIFLSSAFRGEIISSTDLEGGLDLFQELEIAGSNFDSNVEMSSSDLIGIWEGFSLYDLPESWKWMRLDQVGSIVGGGTPDTTNKSYWANGIGTPWITPADMRNQSMFIFGGKRNLTDIGLRESSSKLLPSNSVVFSSRAPIGYVGITGVPLATNQGFKSCVPFIPEMAKFIYFYLMFIGEEINRRATGTTFKEVSGKQFASTPIPIPPLRTQLIIVKMVEEFLSVSEEVDRKILHQAQLANFARKSAVDAISMAQSPEELKVAWERINSNWEVIAGTRESVTSLRQLLVDLAIQGQLFGRRPLGSHGYPAAWEVNDFRSIGNIEGGNQPPKSVFISEPREGYVQLFQIRDLGPNPIPVFIPNDLARSTSVEGEILIGRYGASVGKVFRAKTGAYNVALVKFIYPKEKLDSEFVYWFLKSSRSQALFTGMSRSAQAGFNKRDLAPLLIPVPSKTEQQEIIESLNSLMKICDQLESSFLDASELAGKFARSVSSVSTENFVSGLRMSNFS